MLADLFLCYYESNYVNNSLHLSRYIDDIIIISTDNLNCSIPVAYPSYLKLTENTLQNNSINLLDLKIILKNHQIYTDIYNKRNDFSFNINSFANFSPCLQLSVYKNILSNYLFLIKKLCSSCFKSHNIKKMIYIALLHGLPKTVHLFNIKVSYINIIF